MFLPLSGARRWAWIEVLFRMCCRVWLVQTANLMYSLQIMRWFSHVLESSGCASRVATWQRVDRQRQSFLSNYCKRFALPASARTISVGFEVLYFGLPEVLCVLE